MKVSKREKTLLIVVVLLALVCAYYLLFLKPYLTDISDLNIKKANNETQVQTYAQLMKNVELIDEQIKEKRDEIVEYSNDISVGFDQPPVLVYLEDTVGQYAQKNMFVFGATEFMGQMTISPVNVTMVTTYDGLKGFIEEISSGDYIINVSSIETMISSSDVAANEQLEETPDLSEGLVVEPSPSAEKSEGVLMVEGTDNLLEVTLVLEVYSMFGEVSPDKVYPFDDNSYSYGGDIFY